MPVSIDSEPGTYNMSHIALEKAFKTYPNPKAILIVSLYGMPADFDKLLPQKKVAALFRILKTNVILLKGAPVDEFYGSMVLSKLADGTIIVARDSKTSIDDLVRARDMLRKVGAKILGVVFDNIKK